MKKITITKASNLHAHFRQDDGKDPLLLILAPLFAQTSYYTNAMPNTTPPKKTGLDCVRYGETIMSYVPNDLRENFKPITPIKILWNDDFKTTPKVIEEAHAHGIHWGKMYMRGVTTNSDDGISLDNIRKLDDTFKRMASLGWILQIHGEHPGEKILAIDREFEFHKHFMEIHNRIPNLRMIFEHISDRRTIEMIKQMPGHIGGTLSTHFMYITLNDVVEPGLRPKNSCKPIAKKFEDRDAIIEAATSGDKHWFWGSDAAGHIISNKYKDKGACGCFPGQYDLLWVAKAFNDVGKIDMLEKFVSLNGPKFYGLPIPNAKVILEECEPYKTDTMFHDIEIWNGGEELNWRIATS